MALILYLILLGLACAYALRDWRRAWLALIVCGVIQDPVRKLTPGQPVAVSFLVVGLFVVVLFAARRELLAHAREFAARFPNLNTTVMIFLFFLVVAGFNGLTTYGFDKWKVPLVSFVTYVAPLSAIVLGYTWLQREESMIHFFRLYALLTSAAMTGALLEYLRVESSLLGMVSFQGDFIRHLPGIQIRMLSGFYRSPDIMALHAATLTAIGIMMALRAGMKKEVLFWYGVAGFGFLTCMLAGRRKALYFIAVFCLAFLWRYVRRVKVSQFLAILGIAVILGVVLRNLSSNEETSVYARGALASRGEFAQRLEGGTMETFRQFGLMGAGLGTATQGVRHLLGTDMNVGWQEGGLAKLAIEVGLPGILLGLVMGWIVLQLWLRLTSIRDVEGSSQFMRATLFGFVVANGASFLASAQAYSDAVLALMAGFFVGCLFATAALDERHAASQRAATPETQSEAVLPPGPLPLPS